MTLVSKQLKSNYARLLVSKVYSPTATQSDINRNLQKAWQVACSISPDLNCQEEDNRSVESKLRFIDDYYLDIPEKLYIITGTTYLPASELSLRSSSVINQKAFSDGKSESSVTLFGAGSLEVRLFPVSDLPDYWTFSIKAVR